MRYRKTTSHRTILRRSAAVLVSCALRTSGDPYITIAAPVPLYQEDRIAAQLKRGRIVEARRNPLHLDWLRLRLGNKEYDARRSFFCSQGGLEALRARQIAAQEQRISTLDEEIEHDRRRADQYFAAVAAIRYDHTIQYKVRALVPVVPPTASSAAMTPRTEAPPALRTALNYIDKISGSQARNLARRWEREIDDRERGLARKLKKRRDAAVARARIEARRDRETRLFAMFARTRADTLVDLYITVQDRVRLFEGHRLKYELLRNTVVRGRPSPESSDWMRVGYRGGIYDARIAFFRSRTDIEDEYAAMHANRLQKLADCNTEIDRLRDRERLLESLRLSLTYEYNLTRIPLGNAFPSVGIRIGDFYTTTACPAGAVEVVVASRAQSLVREWDRDCNDLRAKRRRRERSAADARKRLALGEARYVQMQRFFQAGESVGR